MVKVPLVYQRPIVGPYGLFSDNHSRFVIGREVAASSTSGEVLSFMGGAPRFSAMSELGGGGVVFVANACDTPLLEFKEYVEVEEVDFDYGHISMFRNYEDHISIAGVSIAGGVFCSFMLAFGGWHEFYHEVLRSGGSMNLAWDEDGVDYERIIDYVVRLRMVGGRAERLIKSEGYRLW